MPQEPLHIEEINGTPRDYRLLRLSGPITISNFFFLSISVFSTKPYVAQADPGPFRCAHIDSAGIGVLVGAYVNQQKDGRCLAFVGVTQRVRDAMQVTRVEQFFRFYDTETAAHQA